MSSDEPIRMSFIVKASKLCNLRCAYCYEMPELANTQRMALQDVEKMFLNIREFLSSDGDDYRNGLLEFAWHGGEPFAQPLVYWESVIEIQKRVFGADFQKDRVTNIVQSNITLLTKKHMPLLKEHFDVGFSYDVVNSLRVNMANRPTDAIVNDKLELLKQNGLPVGGICVVSKTNVGEPELIADFFLSRGLPFRILNIYHDLNTLPDIRAAAVPFEDFIDFCRKLLASEKVLSAMREGRHVEPLSTAGRLLERWRRVSHGAKGKTKSLAQCAENEWAIAINTNGDVYGAGDMYNPEFRYGNIFNMSLEAILTSEGRDKRVEKSEKRLKKICQKSCFLFGKACNGTFVSHATPESFEEMERVGSCEVGLLARDMRDKDELCG